MTVDLADAPRVSAERLALARYLDTSSADAVSLRENPRGGFAVIRLQAFTRFSRIGRIFTISITH